MPVVTIQLRRDLAANWTSVNPVLHQGEVGVETDTDLAKIGNGTSTWTALSYWNPNGGSGGGGGSVVSVNGQTGVVTLTAAEVGADASGAATTAQGIAETFATGAVATETTRAEAAEALKLAKSANLSDVASPSTSLTNLGGATSAALSAETTRAEAAEVLLAPKASPALTGTPTAPTATPGTDSTQLATTGYADSAVAVETSRAETAEAGALQKSQNLADLPNAATARTNLQLGSAALQPSSAFDSAGLSALETTRAEAAEALLAPKASPTFTGTPSAPTPTAGDNTTKLATTAFVETAVAGAGGGTVTSVFTRTGAVVAASGDYTVGQVTGAAPLASPTLTGVPAAPTAAALTATTQIATTAYADSAVGVETTRAETAEALKAPLASPALTGTPTAPTQTTGDSSTKIATDAFVATAVTNGVATETTRAEAAEALLAPKASPALTGVPTAPTAAALTSTTQVATTAYADSAVGVEKTRALAAEALLAPLASPALTGSPTAPTQTTGDSSTKIATDAFVATAVATETTRAETAEALAYPKAGGVSYTGPIAPDVVAVTFASAMTINPALGNVFSIALTANATITITAGTLDGQTIKVRLAQDATGSRTITTWTNVDFGSTAGTGNTAPTLTTTASKKDYLAFEWDAALTKWVYLSAAFPQGF